MVALLAVRCHSHCDVDMASPLVLEERTVSAPGWRWEYLLVRVEPQI